MTSSSTHFTPNKYHSFLKELDRRTESGSHFDGMNLELKPRRREDRFSHDSQDRWHSNDSPVDGK